MVCVSCLVGYCKNRKKENRECVEDIDKMLLAPTGNLIQGKCLEGIYVATTPLVRIYTKPKLFIITIIYTHQHTHTNTLIHTQYIHTHSTHTYIHNTHSHNNHTHIHPYQYQNTHVLPNYYHQYQHTYTQEHYDTNCNILLIAPIQPYLASKVHFY